MNYSKLGPNNNKFYIIQVLQSDQSDNIFYFYKRWGRVGDEGDQCFKGPITEEEAIKLYEEKYREKIERCQYKELQIKYDTEEQEQEKPTESKDAIEEEKKGADLANVEKPIGTLGLAS